MTFEWSRTVEPQKSTRSLTSGQHLAEMNIDTVTIMTTMTTLPTAAIVTSLNISTHSSNITTLVGQHHAYPLDTAFIVIVVLLGAVGNCLSICIFRRKNVVRSPSIFFLFSLAISDNVYLFILFLSAMTKLGINCLNRNVICQLSTYISMLGNFVSAYITVAYTLQRCIAISLPFYANRMMGPCPKIAIAIMMVVGMLVYTPFLIFVRLDDNKKCDFTESGLKLKLHFADSIFVFIMPFTCIVIMNVIMMWTLKKAGMSDDPTSKRHPMLLTSMNQAIQDSQDRLTRENLFRQAYRNTTKLLVIMSSMFVLINCPFHALNFLDLLRQLQGRSLIITSTSKRLRPIIICAHRLTFVSYAMNFYIYVLRSKELRTELKKLLGKQLRRSF